MLSRPMTNRFAAEMPASSRWPAYLLVNVLYLVMITVGAVRSPGDAPMLYLIALFAICATPVLMQRKLNDRYAIFSAFLAMYFISFGLLDTVELLSGTGAAPRAAALSDAELVILSGAALFAIGYRAAAVDRVAVHRPTEFAVNDWKLVTLVFVGLALWLGGSLANWRWSIVLTVRSGEFHNDSGLLVTTLLMIGRYSVPLGILILAYAHTISRSMTLLALLVGVAVFQVFVGFVSDTKGGAMLGGILAIVAGILVRGKIPKFWLLSAALFIVFAFPVFQSYRAVVVNEHSISNAQAAQDLGKVLELAVSNRSRVANNRIDGQVQSFFQRSSVKSSVEMIVSRTGKDVAYQYGYTFIPLLTAFIPRILWPAKLDVQTGQLVNREFHVTDQASTYISPSHLGELYWNFGWPGVIGGMLLLGAVTGWINRRCEMSRITSVTRFLILAITIFELCVRFESAIGTEYSVWIRSVAGILILHAVFSRTGGAATPKRAAVPSTRDAAAAEPMRTGFSNILP